MKLSLAVTCILIAFASGAVAVGESISIHISGEEDITGVRSITKKGSVFISIDDVSERLDIVPKDIAEGMIGLCRDDICVPVQLDSEEDVLRDSGQLLINADLVASALSSEFQWVISGKSMRFVPLEQVTLDTIIKVGDVVPDFALPSITDGKMVSLSSFRGKRILLFLWASW